MASATDGYVAVQPDSSTGKKVDTSELTRADGTIVERQRVAIGDDLLPAISAKVTTARELSVSAEVLIEIRDQLKRACTLLEIIAGTRVTLRDAT